MTITEFLTARLDEDEAVARAAAPRAQREWAVSPGAPLVEGSRWNVVSAERDQYAPDLPAARIAEMYLEFPYGGERRAAEHIARHDPARLLAEVEAKRRIIDRVEQHARYGGVVLYLLAPLALPYADHPDYDESWRP